MNSHSKAMDRARDRVLENLRAQLAKMSELDRVTAMRQEVTRQSRASLVQETAAYHREKYAAHSMQVRQHRKALEEDGNNLVDALRRKLDAKGARLAPIHLRKHSKQREWNAPEEFYAKEHRSASHQSQLSLVPHPPAPVAPKKVWQKQYEPIHATNPTPRLSFAAYLPLPPVAADTTSLFAQPRK